MRAMGIVAGLLMLAACAPQAGPASPPGPDECGAAALSSLIGAPAAAAPAPSETVRVIRPGDAVTLDYRAERLNVEIGEDGRIERLRCG